jgi:hypothetical protein
MLPLTKEQEAALGLELAAKRQEHADLDAAIHTLAASPLADQMLIQRLKKRNRVVAYADQRTASVVVSASRDLMEQIEDVIHDLDGNLKGQKKVWTFDTGDTDPAEMYPILTEVFGKNNQSNNRNAAGSTSALSTRSSQNNSQMGTSSGSSSSSRTSLGQGVRSGGGGGAGFGSQ